MSILEKNSLILRLLFLLSLINYTTFDRIATFFLLCEWFPPFFNNSMQ